jgi:hypothetical protein
MDEAVEEFDRMHSSIKGAQWSANYNSYIWAGNDIEYETRSLIANKNDDSGKVITVTATKLLIIYSKSTVKRARGV